MKEYNDMMWKAAALNIDTDMPWDELCLAVEAAMAEFSGIFITAMKELAEKMDAFLKSFELSRWETIDYQRRKIKARLLDRNHKLVPAYHKPVVKLGKMYQYHYT